MKPEAVSIAYFMKLLEREKPEMAELCPEQEQDVGKKEINMEAGFRFHTKRSFWLSITILIAPLLWSCGTPINVQPLVPEEIPSLEAAGNFPHKEYRIEPGDTLSIKYTFHPEMNQEVTVLPDGKINAQMVGEIIVAGMTTTRLEKLCVERTSDRLRNPEVVVSISKFVDKNVYIGGEVGKPGTLPYKKDLTPLQAIIASGGFLTSAQVDSVILVRSGGSENKYIARKLNLGEVVHDGVKEPLFLAPNDVVFVPRTGIADANLWVKEHFTDLIGPFLKPPMGYKFQ